MFRDSIVVDKYTQGDTVYLTKDRWHIRDKVSVKVDTIYKSRTDTTFVKVPIEKKASNLERIFDKIMTTMLAMMAVILLLKFGYKRIKGD